MHKTAKPAAALLLVLALAPPPVHAALPATVATPATMPISIMPLHAAPVARTRIADAEAGEGDSQVAEELLRRKKKRPGFQARFFGE